MNKIQIKNRFGGSIIYEYEAENATVKDAVIDAVKNKADLNGANLIGADLRGANLIGANLYEANLIASILTASNLTGADLTGADLNGANLTGTDLTGAIRVPMHCRWYTGITDDKIHIGCKKLTIDKWDAFFASDEIFETPRNTPEFKQIQAVYEGLKAYYQFLNS